NDNTENKTEQVANLIVEKWIRPARIKRGWINEFNKLIAKYVKQKVLNYLKNCKCIQKNVMMVAFSADNCNVIVLTRHGVVEILDIASGKKIKTFERNPSLENDLAQYFHIKSILENAYCNNDCHSK
ncbi:hypothetical protein RFI_33940, partial [Reticulomyxa filosa]